MSDENPTALDIVMASYRDMFGVKTEKANEIHKAACMEVFDMATKIDEQTALLLKAIDLIKQWHNISEGHYRLPEATQEMMWQIYLEHAPEMTSIRDWLAVQKVPTTE